MRNTLIALSLIATVEARPLVNLEKADAHFDIYIHPRAELRLGDIAARRDDRQTAQLHYHTAWNLLARHEEAWSRDLFYVYPDLRELNKLGNLIKSRVE